MDISNLPNDVIKHIEMFVDKSPPFADELLNREFRVYEWCACHEDYNDWFFQEIFDIDNASMSQRTDNHISHVLLYERDNVVDIRFEETLYGYSWDEKCIHHSALGLIMQEDADKQGIPPQTFNCGI